MGYCRAMIYITAGLTISCDHMFELSIAAINLFVYIIGLSLIAKYRNKFPIWIVLPCIMPLVFYLPNRPDLYLVIIYILFLTWLVYILATMYLSKTKHINPIIGLIAGICLLDGTIMAYHGHMTPGAVAVAAFFLTLYLQRWITGD